MILHRHIEEVVGELKYKLHSYSEQAHLLRKVFVIHIRVILSIGNECFQ